MVASMPVQYGSTSLRTFIAITTSSSEALPARSPMPLMVHSIWRAPARDAGERVRHRHAEIVVAVHREARLVGIRHALAHHLEQREVFLRHRVADGVGDVDGGGAGLDRGLDAAAEEIVLGAGAVLAPTTRRRRCGCARASPARSPARRPARGVHLELPLHVHRRGGDEGVDAPALGRLDRLGAAVDVLEGRRARGRRPPRSWCAWRSRGRRAKSPSEAIGKPASMMSTPMSSSSSATSSFSSWVMVAPGTARRRARWCRR